MIPVHTPPATGAAPNYAGCAATSALQILSDLTTVRNITGQATEQSGAQLSLQAEALGLALLNGGMAHQTPVLVQTYRSGTLLVELSAMQHTEFGLRGIDIESHMIHAQLPQAPLWPPALNSTKFSR